jgi:hypothetical protein
MHVINCAPDGMLCCVLCAAGASAGCGMGVDAPGSQATDSIEEASSDAGAALAAVPACVIAGSLC